MVLFCPPLILIPVVLYLFTGQEKNYVILVCCQGDIFDDVTCLDAMDILMKQSSVHRLFLLKNDFNISKHGFPMSL